jgi:hypothetical protein
VKTPNDLLYRERFDEWRRAPRTKVYLTTDQPDKSWHYKIGVVTELFDELTVPPSSIVMMCGPPGGDDAVAAHALRHKGIADEAIYLSMERRMECAVGLCGHCQYREHFVCKDGRCFPIARSESCSEYRAYEASRRCIQVRLVRRLPVAIPERGRRTARARRTDWISLIFQKLGAAPSKAHTISPSSRAASPLPTMRAASSKCARKAAIS